MFGWFKRPSFDLLIEPERITLANAAVRVEVEPRLSVAQTGRILRVGGRPSEQSGRVIELLGPVSTGERPKFEERRGAFVAVFRHLMRAAHKGIALAIRPHVRVHGAFVLHPLLDGDEQRFLREALTRAGAMTVEFAT